VREAELTSALTRLIKDNLDCKEARMRTFDLRWLVDVQTGRCSSWQRLRDKELRQDGRKPRVSRGALLRDSLGSWLGNRLSHECR
jgi:hypothetical protein